MTKLCTAQTDEVTPSRIGLSAVGFSLRDFVRATTTARELNSLKAEPEGARHKLQPAENEKLAILRSLFIAVFAAAMLLWVALYNGYPTVFSDTGAYLLTGAFHTPLAPFRAPGYSVFTRIAGMGVSPWLIVAGQAMLVVYVLREVCVCLIGADRKLLDHCLLATVCVLAALTSLPWFVSLLMPDVFAGILFLCAFLLAYDGELSLVQRIFLSSILTISISTHTSFFPIAALFFAALLIIRLASRQKRGHPSVWMMIPWLLIPFVASACWTSAMNYRLGLGFNLSPSKNTFLMGRLFGDGLAQEFLRENCPKAEFISCQYLSNLPKSEKEFLFQHPLLQALKGHEKETTSIVRGTLLAYPVRFLISSARQTFLQFAAFRTGDEIRSNAAQYWNDGAMQLVFPRDLQAYRNSKQSRDRLLSLADAFAAIHTIVFCVSAAACILFAWTRRFSRIDNFLISAIVFLVINAAICSTLAGVYDRYQSRVGWLIPLCLVAYVCRIVAERGDLVTRLD
jgi:hypothetical protein